jgi:REP element-mobilizing transposase RayT
MKKQIEFNLQKGTWGGRRENSGRMRIKSAGVAHRSREKVSMRTPVHINLKLSHSLRNGTGIAALRRSVENARKYLKILHYSLETNHIHLIIEAKDNEHLEMGMRSFTNTFVKMIGKGSLQKERYHLHVLRTREEVRNAFRYVIMNHLNHTKMNSIKADLFSSLHTLDLKETARLYQVSIIETKKLRPVDLDQPSSWLAKQGFSDLPDTHRNKS